MGLFVALGGLAYAQSPATDQYGGKTTTVTTQTTTTGDTTTTGTTTSETTTDEQTTDEQTTEGVVTDTTVQDLTQSEPQVAGESVSETPQRAVASQALPLTGLSLLFTALVGGGLVALGIALRRRERPTD